MLRTLFRTASAVVLSLGIASAQAEITAITNAELHMTSASGEVIIDGTLLMRGSRIVAVGRDLAIPTDARVIDAAGQPVTPGLFVPISAIGIDEISAVRDANDRFTNDLPGLSAAVTAADAYNVDHSVIDITRAGGLTRAYTTTEPSAGIFGGCGMVVALVRTDNAVMEPCAAQVVALGEGGAIRVGGSRPAAMAMFRKALEDALAYDDDPETYALSDAEDRLSVSDARALVDVATGNQLLLVHVEGASDIRRVVELKRRFDLEVVLVGASEAYRVADLLAAQEIPVIINPLSNLPVTYDMMGATLKAAPMLADAGVSVTFYDDGSYTHNARLLPQLAGNAVAEGMSHAAAMRAVTLTPAEIYGVSRDLGTLERGKLADVVVWDGDPFEVTARPVFVFVEGEETSLENRQTDLANRYKDLRADELPFQYRN